MTTQNPGAGGLNPQAQGLREIEEDADALLALLQGFIDHAGGEQDQLITALVEYHRRSLQSDETIDLLGVENQRQAGRIFSLEDELVERLRLIHEQDGRIGTLRGGLAESERKLKLAGLTQKQQRALIRFLREQQGGIVLQTGEPPMSKSCRGLPLEAIAIAIVLGCVLGTFIDRWGWITSLNHWVGKPALVASILVIVAVIARLLIHLASNTAEWQEFYKPVDLLVAKLCKWTGYNPPAPVEPPAEIASLRDEAREIRERAVDGLDAKRVELNDLQQRINQLQGELDAKTLEVTQKTGEVEINRQQLATLNSILGPLLTPVPPAVRDQAAVDAATNSMRMKSAEIDALLESLRDLVDEANQKRAELDGARTLLNGPDGLDEEVKDLESQCKQKLDAAKTLEDDHNMKVCAPRWHYIMKWKALAFSFVLLLVAGLWDAADVNKKIGQSDIAEGRAHNDWYSGGEPMADPSKREQHVRGIPELQLGKDGPITAVKMPDGRILVFLGAGDISAEDRRKIQLSEFSAPPSGK